MAESMFNEHFQKIMEDHIRESLEETYIWANTEIFTMPSEEIKEKAKEWADKIIKGGKALDVLEALAKATTCPCCGR